MYGASPRESRSHPRGLPWGFLYPSQDIAILEQNVKSCFPFQHRFVPVQGDGAGIVGIERAIVQTPDDLGHAEIDGLEPAQIGSLEELVEGQMVAALIGSVRNAVDFNVGEKSRNHRSQLIHGALVI